MSRKEEARKESGPHVGGAPQAGPSQGGGAAAAPSATPGSAGAPQGQGPPAGRPDPAGPGPSPAGGGAAPPAAAPAAAAAPATPPTDPQLASLRDQLARARADYENLQRRVARDAAAETERTRARVLEGFLPLLELAHMAAQQAEAHPGPLSEGVRLLAREFDRMAEREGLTRLGTKGEKADPARHEVIATEAAEGVASGCVSRVVQPGYLLGSRVLRYAKVCVAP